MQFEPAWNLAIIATVGLAALYLWYFLALSRVMDRPLGRLRERFPLLIGCPWCLGFWLTGLILIVAGSYDPLTHLAAAAVTGLLGSHSE
jgi:hypothetical protein